MQLPQQERPLAHRSSVSGLPIVLEENWNTFKRVAVDLQGAGIFPDTVKTPAQAAVILLACHELSLPFTMGARMIDVIYGRIALRGQLVGALLRSKGCKVRFLQSTDKVAEVEIVRPDDARPFAYKVTFEEASALRTFEEVGGTKKSIPLTDKYNWKQMPRVMLQRFCLKQAANVHCEDMTLGLYSDDEVEMMEPITVTATAVETQAPKPETPSLSEKFRERTASPAATQSVTVPPVETASSASAPQPEQPAPRKRGLF